jgi:hypothetical protein
MHGGKSLRGRNSAVFKHGRYAKDARAESREIVALIARAQDTLEWLREALA